MRHLILAIFLLAAPTALARPFDGTAFVSPAVLTAADPSGLRPITYDGRGERRLFDRRVDDWGTVEAYLFTARLAAVDVEFQVNSEFGSQAAARAEVDVFAPALNRLPAVMLSRIDSAWVYAGDDLFGAAVGGSSILIHTDYGRGIDRDGYLEEVLFHEAADVSLDPAFNLPDSVFSFRRIPRSRSSGLQWPAGLGANSPLAGGSPPEGGSR